MATDNAQNQQNLGTTQYLQFNTNGNPSYQAIPYAGNTPYGATAINKDQYTQAVQGAISGGPNAQFNTNDIARYQKELPNLQSNTGVHAPGYVDPTFAKFNPTGAADFNNLNPQGQAQFNTNQVASTNANAIASSGNFPGGSQQPLNQTAATMAGSTPGADPLTQKYTTALANLKSGKATAPQTAGPAGAAVSGATPPPSPAPYDSTTADSVLQDNQAHQQYMTDYANSQTQAAQQQTLTQEYSQMQAQAGIPALQTQLMNMQTVMNGSEQDIRDEIQKAGGFATNSQVLALTDARNKTMIQNYNNLQTTYQNAISNINTMMQFSQQDRAYAQQQVSNQLQYDQNIIQFADKALTNAQDSIKNQIATYGANSVYQQALASGDPTAVARINSTMGSGFDLAIAASTVTPADTKAGLENQLLTAQIANTKENTLKTANDISQSSITNSAALTPYTKTAYDGTKYADLSSLSKSDQVKYAQIAQANGYTPIFDTGTSSKIGAISDSKTNLQSISDSLSKLINNATPGAIQGVGNSISDMLGNKDVRQFNAWRTAIINNVQALAGGAGSGLRINKAEIDSAMQNDLPVITGTHADTLAQAQGKLEILNKQLDTWNKQILGGGNQASQTTTPKLLQPTEIPSGYYQASDGLLYKK